MWNLTSLRVARACRKLGRVARCVCSAASQQKGVREDGPGASPPSLTVSAPAARQQEEPARVSSPRRRGQRDRGDGAADQESVWHDIGESRHSVHGCERSRQRFQDDRREVAALRHGSTTTGCVPQYATLRRMCRAVFFEVPRHLELPQTCRCHATGEPGGIQAPKTGAFQPMLTPQRAYGQQTAPLGNVAAPPLRRQAQSVLPHSCVPGVRTKKRPRDDCGTACTR